MHCRRLAFSFLLTNSKHKLKEVSPGKCSIISDANDN